MKKGNYGVWKGVQLKDKSGNPLDCTGLTVKMKVRRVAAPDTVVLEKTLEAVEPTQGKFKWTVTQEDSNILAVGRYVCEAELLGTGYHEDSGDWELEVKVSA